MISLEKRNKKLNGKRSLLFLFCFVFFFLFVFLFVSLIVLFCFFLFFFLVLFCNISTVIHLKHDAMIALKTTRKRCILIGLLLMIAAIEYKNDYVIIVRRYYFMAYYSSMIIFYRLSFVSKNMKFCRLCHRTVIFK